MDIGLVGLMVGAGWVIWITLIILVAFFRVRSGALARNDFFLYILIYGIQVPPALTLFVAWWIVQGIAYVLQIPASLLAGGLVSTWAGRFTKAYIRRLNDDGLSEMNSIIERRWAVIHYGSYEKYLTILEDQKLQKRRKEEAKRLRKLLEQAANINNTLQKQGSSILDLMSSGEVTPEELASWASTFGTPFGAPQQNFGMVGNMGTVAGYPQHSNQNGGGFSGGLLDVNGFQEDEQFYANGSPVPNNYGQGNGKSNNGNGKSGGARTGNGNRQPSYQNSNQNNNQRRDNNRPPKVPRA